MKLVERVCIVVVVLAAQPVVRRVMGSHVELLLLELVVEGSSCLTRIGLTFIENLQLRLKLVFVNGK